MEVGEFGEEPVRRSGEMLVPVRVDSAALSVSLESLLSMSFSDTMRLSESSVAEVDELGGNIMICSDVLLCCC